jgi:hypothetical protein
VNTFNLGSYASVAMMCHQWKEENMTLPLLPVGDTGYEIPLLEYLEWYLEHNLPPTTNKPLELKFALDGANMTLGKWKMQEVGGFQVLTPGELLASVKSPKSCHVFVIYIGGKTEEELQQCLANMNTV